MLIRSTLTTAWVIHSPTRDGTISQIRDTRHCELATDHSICPSMASFGSPRTMLWSTLSDSNDDVDGTKKMMIEEGGDDPEEERDDPTTTELLEQRRQLYALLESADPEWYQEYVLDILDCPPEECHYPAILQHTIMMSQGDDGNSSNEELPRREEIADADVDRVNESTTSTQKELLPMDNTIEDSPTVVVQSTQQDQLGGGENEDNDDEDNKDTVPVSVVLPKSNNEPPSDPVIRATKTISITDSTLESENISSSLDVSLEPSTFETPLNQAVSSDVEEVSEARMPMKSAIQEVGPPSTPDTRRDVVQDDTESTSLPVVRSTQSVQDTEKVEFTSKETVAVPVVESSRVLVYRDSRQGWKMTEMTKLIQLGYMEKELQDLLPDALAIIIEQQIRRPRALGLPSAWKIPPGGAKSVELQIVADTEKAETLLDSLRFNEDSRLSSRVPKERRTRGTEVPPQTSQLGSPPPSKSNPTADEVITPPPSPRSSQSMETKIEDKFMPPSIGLEKVGTAQSPENVTAVTTSGPIGSESVEITAKQQQLGENDETGGAVLVYRDFTKSLTFIPIANLSLLGYRMEEITSMRAETLAVIVSDRVTRPRQGIPSQWKIEDSTSTEIELVESIEAATLLVEEDRATIRSRRRERSPETTSAGTRTPSKDQNGNESMRKTSARGEDPSKSQREKRREKMEDPELRRSSRWKNNEQASSSQEKDEGSFDDPQGRPRRRNLKADGSTKRIYNAREIQNRRKQSTLADPPDPNSPIWVDIDTFRSLLRDEAELRLRILGDDWAKTVKQESEWRLDLYKKWLWTLHNGVGDSIVPPSRYERARKLKEQQMQDESRESARKRSSSSQGSRGKRK